MKKSEISKNENPHVPSIEEVSSDIEVILDILDQIDIANLDTNTDIKKLSKEINSKLEEISKKYEPLIDSLSNKNK